MSLKKSFSNYLRGLNSSLVSKFVITTTIIFFVLSNVVFLVQYYQNKTQIQQLAINKYKTHANLLITNLADIFILSKVKKLDLTEYMYSYLERLTHRDNSTVQEVSVFDIEGRLIATSNPKVILENKKLPKINTQSLYHYSLLAFCQLRIGRQ